MCWIGCSTESIWIPRFKSSMLTPKPNGRHVKQSVVMSRRSQEGLSDDSPSVKAKPRPKAMNLVSHRNLSIASQISENANDSEFLESGWTATMLSCGKPLQESTESLSLTSQERTQGITCKIGSKHSVENVSSHGIGKPMQGTWNQESSENLRQKYDCSTSFGRPGTRTQENGTNPELYNMEVTNTEYKNKVFQNLRNKLAEVKNLPEFAMEAYQTNMLILELVFHFMDEGIWVRKTWSIWKFPRTQRSTILRVCSMLPRIWLRTTQKNEMWNV